jgi:predicted ester cyclase
VTRTSRALLAALVLAVPIPPFAAVAQEQPPQPLPPAAEEPAPPAETAEAAEPAVQPEPPPEIPIEEANKLLVQRYIEEVLSAGNLELVPELVSRDFVDRTPGAPPQTRGPAVVLAAQRRAREAFRDVHYAVDELIAEGGRVAARYTVRAVRNVPEGDPEAGRPVEITGITIFHIERGKIAGTWIVNDQLQMFQQLGYQLEPPKP